MKRNSRDAAKARYWKDSKRVADFLNVNFFDGEQVFTADDIKDISGTLTAEISTNEEKYTIQRTADVAKVIHTGGKVIKLYLENQEKVDYTMPVRCLMLEAAGYHEQCNELRKHHKQSNDWTSGEEFLSGFLKTDRLTPIIVITLYYGKQPWDGAKNLRELLSVPEERKDCTEFVSDYHMMLFDVRRLENMDQYCTDIREAFSFIKYSADKEKLSTFIDGNQKTFANLREDAYDFIAFMTNSTILKKLKKDYQTEGGYDMCKALRDMIKDGEKRGEMKGILAMIQDNFELDAPTEIIADKLQKYFSLSREDALKQIAECK